MNTDARFNVVLDILAAQAQRITALHNQVAALMQRQRHLLKQLQRAHYNIPDFPAPPPPEAEFFDSLLNPRPTSTLSDDLSNPPIPRVNYERD